MVIPHYRQADRATSSPISGRHVIGSFLFTVFYKKHASGDNSEQPGKYQDK
jgi:hypothetical protein